jgi:alkanesulfonate monooxygenase SsuD/methylene tetrahydromethanopterin reductase-like flavin-dependent oxidoreductase (luciferase family)
MKTGLFCNYESHYQDSHRAFTKQIALVKHVESLGFDEVWVTEHHFNDFSVSSSTLMLLAHLAGITSKIKLDLAAVLLGLHNLIRVAEDIATLGQLCNGRLLLR